MKKWIVSLLVACLVFLPSFTQVDASSGASIPNEVSVKLKYHLKERKAIPFNFNGTYQLAGSALELKQDRNYEVKLNGSVIELYENGKKIKSFNQAFDIKPVKYGKSNYIRLNGRPYLGSIRFTIENNYLVPVNKLPMEDYLKGVLPSEIYPSWHIEALKAQAVAARTYALKRVHQIITDDVGSQRYDGYIWWDESKYANTNEAVNATKGQVLTYKGSLIDAVFSSNNGGYIEANKGAWPGGSQLDYLNAKADHYDPAFDWNLLLRSQQMEVESLDLEVPNEWWGTTQEIGIRNPLKFASTNEAKVINNVKNHIKSNTPVLKEANIKIVGINDVAVSNSTTPGQRRTHGSYTVEYFVQNKDGSFVMETINVDNEEITRLKLHTFEQVNSPIAAMRGTFGINDFKSHFVTSISLKDGVYDIKGKGWGHGVGMSQYGAKAMADQGKAYTDILGFYYEGTTFSNYISDHINNSLRGSDRYETSTAIAKYGWDQGFQTVVIGRGDNPVDALTGSVLAKKYDAPLLLVKTDELPSSVNELLLTQTIHQIFVLGGQAAISDRTVSELSQYATQVTRIKGSDRYDTSVEVASNIDAEGEVILTSGSSASPDALSVASHAALNQIPILFTKVDELPESVQKYLKDNNVKKATIIGGGNAVSAEVEAKLSNLVGEVKRVSGPDRYATSVAIVNEYNLDPRNLFFARGEQFIDALPGSVLAAKMDAPLLLTKKDTLPDVVSNYINENIHYVPSIHYLGGTGAISENTRSKIELDILE